MGFLSKKMKTFPRFVVDEVFVFMQDGRTPLIMAAEEGHLDICQELIERGAAIDHQAEVRTPIFSS